DSSRTRLRQTVWKESGAVTAAIRTGLRKPRSSNNEPQINADSRGLEQPRISHEEAQKAQKEMTKSHSLCPSSFLWLTINFCLIRANPRESVAYSILAQQLLSSDLRAASRTSCVREPSAKVAASATVVCPSCSASTICFEKAVKPRAQPPSRIPGANSPGSVSTRRHSPSPTFDCHNSPLSSIINVPS